MWLSLVTPWGWWFKGKNTTTSVTMENMIYHSKCVSGGLERAFAIGDMPFMSSATVELALHNATRFIQEGRMQMVKIETHAESSEVLHALSVRGISCCAHMGLKLQAVHKTGGYKVQVGTKERHSSRVFAHRRKSLSRCQSRVPIPAQ